MGRRLRGRSLSPTQRPLKIILILIGSDERRAVFFYILFFKKNKKKMQFIRIRPLTGMNKRVAE